MANRGADKTKKSPYDYKIEDMLRNHLKAISILRIEMFYHWKSKCESPNKQNFGP